MPARFKPGITVREFLQRTPQDSCPKKVSQKRYKRHKLLRDYHGLPGFRHPAKASRHNSLASGGAGESVRL